MNGGWLLAACLGGASTPAVPAAPPSHPGTIVMVDLDDGRTWEQPADQVPETVAWVTLDGAAVPVVRVESRSMGTGREILQYGADGTLLATTVGGPPPQP